MWRVCGACDCLTTRRETTAQRTPEHNAAAESSIWWSVKAGHPVRLEVPRLYLDINLGKVKNVGGKDGRRLWLVAMLWTSEGFSRSATSVYEDASRRARDFIGN